MVGGKYKVMANACLGAKGFIGNAILRASKVTCPDEEWIGITHENYQLWKGYKFNKFVFAGGSASKELCEDWSYAYDINVKQVKQSINDFPCEKFIYVSSQAVYMSSCVCPDEEVKIDETELSKYGKSKYLGELAVREMATNFVVFRPNGFSGPGLKKNAVFYMAQPEPLLYYDWDSYAQYLHVDTFADILLNLSQRYKNEIFNLTSPDIINMRSVAILLGVEERKVKPFRTPLPLVQAEIKVDKMLNALQDVKYYSEMLRTINSRRAVLYWNKSLWR